MPDAPSHAPPRPCGAVLPFRPRAKAPPSRPRSRHVPDPALLSAAREAVALVESGEVAGIAFVCALRDGNSTQVHFAAPGSAYRLVRGLAALCSSLAGVVAGKRDDSGPERA